MHFHGIMAAIELQRHAGMFEREHQFIPHPSTWLNGERWDDEIAPRQNHGIRNGAALLLARELNGPKAIEGDDTE
jgi:hypothetical protein